MRDVVRVLRQPLRKVNWRQKADSWQNSLLNEAKRLHQGVRETLEKDWPDPEDEDRRVEHANALARASEAIGNEATGPSVDAGPSIIVARESHIAASPEPQHLVEPTTSTASLIQDAAWRAQGAVRSRLKNWLPQSHPEPTPALTSEPLDAERPMSEHVGLRPLPPNPIVSDAQVVQASVAQPAVVQQAGQISQAAMPGGPRVGVGAMAVAAIAPAAQSSWVPRPPSETASQSVLRPGGAPDVSIAEQFAAFAADDGGVEDDHDDVDETSRAMARRFAPANAQIEVEQPIPPPSVAQTAAAPRDPMAVTGTAVPGMLRGASARTARVGFVRPSTNLLSRPSPAQTSFDATPEQLRVRAEALQSVLADFGIKGAVKNIHPGPVVTLYEFEPARGTKSSRVIGLADDIARSMSAISARVAVVPGRNAIGIELPNSQRQSVYLREILDAQAFRTSQASLPLALGKSIGGEPIIADLARMPHLLVAGTTGSGKSVGVNAMVLSMLYRHAPDACRLLMIDPKMLELSIYNNIPHLLSPVITDPQQAVVALNWAVREMEERYKRMTKLSVRNIDVYNNRVRNAKKRGERLSRTVHTGFDASGQAIYEQQNMDLEVLPYIVIVVDEFADLMLVAGKELEAAIQRLAQMARAAGIHLIMATQRPSVDVITGTIKANFPTRMSFKVTSKVDSRTILNEQGAEQLLGQGDMLYASGSGQTVRIHGPFVSDEEVEAIADHLRSQGAPKYVAEVTESQEPANQAHDTRSTGTTNDLFDQALAIVQRDRKASTSYIQRRLAIGYNRAADLIERMEREGVIGPAGPGGKRDILISAGSTADNAA
ncbi:MAG: DNA translocase FtsK [Alphaproteobacteria bacterium]|nr:DNA translocase FtsK [Alphaproteobacteria bacterium]